MNPDMTLGQALFFASLFIFWVATACLQVYGIYTCFRKKWYMGLAAIAVPGFAFVIGLFKLFKKDLLV